MALVAGAPSKTTRVSWIAFTVPSNAGTGVGSNSAAVRVGDSAVSATRGAQVPIQGLIFPSMAGGQYLDLTQVYAFIGNGDKLQVTYGVL